MSGSTRLTCAPAARALLGAIIVLACMGAPPALGAEAPKWMHALATVPLPAYDEKTQAVQLYSETSISVQPSGRIKRLERKAFKVLRPGGEKLGTLAFGIDRVRRVTDLHAWCIPTSGKDYAVKQHDALEAGLSG